MVICGAWSLLPPQLNATTEHDANEIILTCSHPQICRLIEWSYPSDENSGESLVQSAYPLEQIQGDPHHFEPSSRDIHGLLNAKILITPPLIMQPWLKAVVQRRERNNQKTLILSLEEWEKNYPQASQEALAHFWLFPEGVCSAQKQIVSFLETTHEKYAGKSSQLDADCHELSNELEKVLSEYKEKVDRPIIISHDAITPHLKRNGISYITIRSGGHGARINSRDMRSLEKTLKEAGQEQLLWVNEHNIFENSQIRSKIRQQDKVLNLLTDGPIDTSKSAHRDCHGTYFRAPLKEFIEFIKHSS